MKAQLPGFLIFLVTAASAVAAPPSPNLKADVVYKTTEEGPLYVDLYYPKNTGSSDSHPLVIYTHGGGWAAGSRKAASVGHMSKVVSGLNDLGFCVASVEYRLYTKGGQITIKDCVTDCKDAVRFLVKEHAKYSIDPERLFTFGDSAGGHLAQMLLLTPALSLPGDPELSDLEYTIQAGVSWYGPCDFERTELFNHDGRPNFRDRFGPRILKPDSDTKNKLTLYREMSPVTYLKPTSPPLLLIQGNKDTTIPVHHARYMKEKADALKAPVEVIIVENAGHNWRQVDAPLSPPVEEIVQKTITFIADHLPR